MMAGSTTRKVHWLSLLALALNVQLALSIYLEPAEPAQGLKQTSRFYFHDNDTDLHSTFNTEYGAELKQYKSAEVISDAPVCAKIAGDVMRRKGSIADATIAALVCMGSVHPHTSGLGGGFIAIHYDPRTKRSTVINARERAPLKATENMYDKYRDDEEKTRVGGLAIATPGEVKGYLELYKRFGGKVSWASLFEPSAQILERGYQVSPHLAQALPKAEERIRKFDSLKEVFVNPKTDAVWVEGDTIKEPVLAKTLRAIGANGNDFYNPSSNLNKAMMRELKKNNAILTEEDFTKYQVAVSEGIQVPIEGGLRMHSPGAPASGALLSFIFRILGQYRKNLKDDDIPSTHLLIEALKHTYGRRSKLGDPADTRYRRDIENFQKNITESDAYLKAVLRKISSTKTNPDYSNYQDEPYSKMDHGTSQFVIVGETGEAISVTTTINTYFGSSVRSKECGIIFNDQMDDFLVDQEQRKKNPFNSIQGGKRPSSSASPVVFTDRQGQVRMTTGAAGGVRILSAITGVSVNHLWYGKSIDEAIESMRFHHVMDPEDVQVEFERQTDKAVNRKFKQGLEKYGHKVKDWTQRTVVVAISRNSDGTLAGSWDSRKPGSADGF